MKKATLMAFLLAFLAPITSAWAFGTTYYAAIKTQVSSNSTGMGKVYAATSTSETSSNYGNSSKASATGSASSSGSSASITLYAFAKAEYGYKLDGWSNNRILVAICIKNAENQKESFMRAIEVLRTKHGANMSPKYYFFFKKEILSKVKVKKKDASEPTLFG